MQYYINFHYYMWYKVRSSVPKAVLNSSTKRKKGACTMTRRRPRPIESTDNFSKLIIQYTDWLSTKLYVIQMENVKCQGPSESAYIQCQHKSSSLLKKVYMHILLSYKLSCIINYMANKDQVKLMVCMHVKHVEWNRSEYEEGIVPDICKILLI